ncbi:MAG: hypothetical protein WBQ94_03575 [Terracidiphilus sp.]
MFSPEQAERICQHIQSGLTTRQAAAIENVSQSEIVKNAGRDPEFGNQYARALEIRTELDFEGLVDTVQESAPTDNFGRVDSGWVNHKRLQVDTIKWALSKRNPKKYGDKTVVAGDPDNPLQIVKRVVTDI